MLKDIALVFKAIVQTGILSPRPISAIIGLGWCWLRYGASLYVLVAWHALRNPSGLAVVEPGKSLTYQELRFQSEQLAAAINHNFGQVRSVGILCRNHIAYVEILLACGRLGLEVVLLNTTFSSEQLAALLQQKHLDLIFCDEEFGPRIEASKGEISSSEKPQILYTNNLQLPSHIGARAHPTGLQPLKKPGKITVLTSGTTGLAKIVQRKISPSEALGTALSLLDGLQPKKGESVLLTIPLLHGHGLATLGLSLAIGSPLYLFPKATAKDFLECIQVHSIKAIVLVPTILYRIVETLSQQGFEASSIRAIICGSAPLDTQLATRSLRVFGPVLYNLYGSSEAGIISLATPEDLAKAPSTVGRVLPKVNLQIVGTQGLAPLRKIGTIYARGMDTGDIGYLDDEGRLFLLGRADDLLICGGENVYPQAIEDRVCQNLEYVQECAATPIPDLEYGQAIQLFVVLKPGNLEIASEKIKQDLEAVFPRTIRPKKITIVESLPRNLAGKLQRFKLQDLT